MAADAVIALRPEATVSGSVFRLQDVASMTEIDPAASLRLAAIEIGVVPRPGHTERLSQQQVERAIEARAPEWRGRFKMGGSKTVAVRAVGVAVDQQRMLRLAARSIASRISRSLRKSEDHASRRGARVDPAAGSRSFVRVLPAARSRGGWRCGSISRPMDAHTPRCRSGFR